ncbi:response regulator transcription factor [Salisediminibacterium beveridgei]|uniref:Putative two-component system response regulator n=1 Tax=Salisediminibacterium beveridgei TaxID=632773 RepID=A0A1D7QR05_9BACI|nr:response regulator transcription factor [Salisediminibacterium beveridgei]AOM81451.1 putative two-component system response regulator [Salisediminibacterium beveridgei]
MIRLLIAEDQKMLLGALASLLDMEDDIHVIGTVNNGREAVEAVKEKEPDLCVMDIEMPEMNGLDAAGELRDHSCKVLILTTFARSGYFQKAMSVGVDGYMLKDSPSEELANAIRQIMQGRRIFAPELIDEVYRSENPLTAREKEVMDLMAEGLSTKMIAETLFLTNGTVRNYISTILDKLEVDNRIEAIKVYQHKGWNS